MILYSYPNRSPVRGTWAWDSPCIPTEADGRTGFSLSAVVGCIPWSAPGGAGRSTARVTSWVPAGAPGRPGGTWKATERTLPITQTPYNAGGMVRFLKLTEVKNKGGEKKE